MDTILLVDDEPNVHYSFSKVFGTDFRVEDAASGEEAVAKVRKTHPDIVILDVRMPGMGGLAALAKIREIDPRLPVIVTTGYGSLSAAIEAMRLGAFDYVPKPFEVPRMRTLIVEALATRKAMEKSVRLGPEENEAAGEDEGGETIVGQSPAMQEVYKRIGQVANRDVTVLILGESGTGKELVARALYQHSSRRERPFLAVNCAAIPDTLLESELFGFERGSFTGAVERRLGKFEQASRGTLFLDEIGEMPAATQAKLLRVIQEGELFRIGGRDPIKVDVRLLVATNKEMKRAIAEGKFREDLFFRLNVITIQLPPLRERREDILPLARYFLRRHGKEFHRPGVGLSEEAETCLLDYEWPGNVRELENVIRRALVTFQGTRLRPKDLTLGEAPASQPAAGSAGGFAARAAAPLPFTTPSRPADHPTGEAPAVGTRIEDLASRILEVGPIAGAKGRGAGLLQQVEKEMVLGALHRTGGNQVQAAKLLGIGRNTLRRKIEKYKIHFELKARSEAEG